MLGVAVLEQIVQRLPIGIAIWRRERDDAASFRLVYANPVATTLVGPYLGKTLLEAFPYLAETSIPARMLKVVNEGRPQMLDEFGFQAELAPCGLFATHVFPLDDRCVGMAIENVGARRRAREAASRVSTVLERSREAIIATDLADNITYWSQGAQKTYGWTREEALGRNAVTLFKIESQPLVHDILATALANGYWEGELRHTCKDGSQAVVFSRWILQHDADEKPSGWLKLNSDVTRQKEVEFALSREREFSERLIESSLDGIFAFDRSFRCTVWNRAMQTLTGIAPETALDRDVFEVLPFLMEIGEQVYLAAALEGRSVSNTDRPYWIAATGRRGFYEGRYTPIRADAGAAEGDGAVIGGLVMMRDVTERRQSEESLRQLSARLLQIQDDERRRIARELHDGTTQMLMGIKLNLSSLRRTMDPGKTAMLLTETVGLADRAAQEIRTTSYLLHPAELDLVGLAGALRSYVRGFSERTGIATEVAICEDLGRLPQDVETALFRIVQESLANVHRHSQSSKASVRLERAGNLVKEEIQDFGCGMPSGAEWSDVSPGVGIAGMRARVRQLGGEMQIDSSVSGTIVRVAVLLKPAIELPGGKS